MAQRIPGPDPPTWTCQDVERWLKAAFRAMPYAPIYARGTSLRTATGDTPSATFDILAFSGTVLGEKSDERKAVLLWARAIATGGDVGGSIAQFCDGRAGWSRSTFERRRRRACERIAEAKNREDAAERSRNMGLTVTKPVLDPVV